MIALSGFTSSTNCTCTYGCATGEIRVNPTCPQHGSHTRTYYVVHASHSPGCDSCDKLRQQLAREQRRREDAERRLRFVEGQLRRGRR